MIKSAAFVLAVAVLAFAALTLVSAAGAVAQDRYSPSAGSTNDRRGARPSPPLEEMRADKIADGEVEAQQGYELAVAELGRGRRADAQRRLEWLIARHPDSPYADAARVKVAELADSDSLARARSNLGVTPPVTADRADGGWRIVVKRVPSLADELRATIGDRVFFAPGSSELGGRARTVLKAQADWLKRHPGVTATIEGHADDPGSSADNRVLAERRADAVRRRLIEEGVAGSRIDVAAYGSDRRVALCRDAVCSAQNRRAVSTLQERPSATPAVAADGPGGDGRARVGLRR